MLYSKGKPLILTKSAWREMDQLGMSVQRLISAIEEGERRLENKRARKWLVQARFSGKFALIRYADLGDKIVVINRANNEKSDMMAGKYLKKCPVCGGPTKRAKTAYVVGNVVVEPELEADVCTKCGEEFFTAEQVAHAQERAAKLGALTAQLEEERELKKVGGSLVVSIPSAMARIMNLAPEEKVKMRLTKQGISITKVEK